MAASRIAVSGIAIVALLALPACHRTPREGTFHVTTATDAQRKLALDATETLREDLNNGACQSIYIESSTFFRTQSPEEWKSQCDKLRKTLGTWQSFNLSLAEFFDDSPILFTRGPAAFANRTTEISTGWRLDHGTAKLNQIDIKQDEEHWTNIPVPRDFHPFADPPMRRPETDARPPV